MEIGLTLVLLSFVAFALTALFAQFVDSNDAVPMTIIGGFAAIEIVMFIVGVLWAGLAFIWK